VFERTALGDEKCSRTSWSSVASLVVRECRLIVNETAFDCPFIPKSVC
jgi:hypothetical protein